MFVTYGIYILTICLREVKVHSLYLYFAHLHLVQIQGKLANNVGLPFLLPGTSILSSLLTHFNLFLMFTFNLHEL